jgi:hypothetical protein
MLVVNFFSAAVCRRPRYSSHLQLRLGDVGDAWRALLLGAPPGLL